MNSLSTKFVLDRQFFPVWAGCWWKPWTWNAGYAWEQRYVWVEVPVSTRKYATPEYRVPKEVLRLGV